MDHNIFEEWVKILEYKKQMILFGPAGTGKTFVAERFARYLVSGTGGGFRKVQFHPSYSYEDFVEGIRPKVEGNNVKYEVVPGIFMEMCALARNTQTRIMFS